MCHQMTLQRPGLLPWSMRNETALFAVKGSGAGGNADANWDSIACLAEAR